MVAGSQLRPGGKFSNVDLMMIGERELTIQHVLEYCDGPLLFVAEDAAESKYVCSFLSNTEGRTEFLCSRFSPSLLRKFLSGGIDLREAITTAPLPENFLLKIQEGAEEESFIASPIQDLRQIDEDLLPADGYFIPPSIGHPLLSHEFAFLEASLEISEAKEAPLISSYSLSEFLKVFQDFIKFSYKRSISILPLYQRKLLSSPEYYTTQVSGIGEHASFKIQFRSKQDADLSHFVELERALNKAEAILEQASNPKGTIEILQSERGHLAGSYIKLLNYLVASKASLRLKWSSPGPSSTIKRFSLSIDNAFDIQTELSKIDDLGEEKITLIGSITQLNTESGRWTLHDNEGGSHSGKIEDGKNFGLAGIIAKTARYQLKCKEHIEEDAIGRETRTLLLYEAPQLLE